MTGTSLARAAAVLVLIAAASVGAYVLNGTGAAPERPKPVAPAKRAVPPVAAPARNPIVALPLPAPGFVIKRVLDLGSGIAFGDWAWDERGAPAGPITVTVDLHAQTLSVFRDGHEIGATAVLYGATEKPTPLGSYPIMAKKRHHVSNLYGAPMPYMLRLTNDGIAIHASDVQYGYATHGCIGVPSAFAAKLFAAVKPGDIVIITNSKKLLKVGDRVA